MAPKDGLLKPLAEIFAILCADPPARKSETAGHVRRGSMIFSVELGCERNLPSRGNPQTLLRKNQKDRVDPPTLRPGQIVTIERQITESLAGDLKNGVGDRGLN